MKTFQLVLYWFARLVAAAIMLQTLFYKFSGSEESVYIFNTVGMEPWGRILVGVLELIASILLLVNTTAWMGATLAGGLMLGAIGMHVLFLGIEVRGDGGLLFFYALAVLACSIVVLIIDKQHVTRRLMAFFK